MIRNQWYVVLDSVQVKNQLLGVTRLGEKLVFWRDPDGRLGCLRDTCVHRGVALSKGKVINGRLQCPFHGFEYDSSGRVALIPANGRNSPVPRGFVGQSYPTHEAHGWIWIWWGLQPPENLPPPPYFKDIGTELRYATAQDPWKAHYSRVIENQLDVMHLPFVHDNTIGSGGRTLVDGLDVFWDGDERFRVYVHNRLDDGTPPRKPNLLTVPNSDTPFWLEFIFPNLWQNHISEQVRILAAFVPVDDAHTLLYLRFYQKFFNLPILGDIISRLAMPMNLYIAHQDRRVVNTHCGASSLRGGEMLVQGDRPIVEYRRRRQELIELVEK